MSLTVTNEAVAALKTMSTRLKELQQDLQQGASTLKTTFETNRAGLGAHDSSILALLEALDTQADQSGVPVKKLVKRLTMSANVRQQHMDHDGYSRSR